MLYWNTLSQKGQSLSEMGIAIALIAVVGIVGLTMLGSTVQNGLGTHQKTLDNQALTQLMAKDAQNAREALSQAQAQAQASAAAVRQDQAENAPADGALGLTMGNGQELLLNDYPADLSQSIETAGANGTTNQLLATLDSMISQVSAMPGVSQEDVNALKSLSGKGHQIADIQAGVEMAIKAGKKDVETAGLGFSPSEGTEDSTIGEFRDLLQKAKKTPLLQDATLSQSVSVLVNQIINISNGVDNAAYNLKQGDISKKQFNQTVASSMFERDEELGTNTKQTLLDLGASVVSHQTANQICQIGKAGDNCQDLKIDN